MCAFRWNPGVSPAERMLNHDVLHAISRNGLNPGDVSSLRQVSRKFRTIAAHLREDRHTPRHLRQYVSGASYKYENHCDELPSDWNEPETHRRRLQANAMYWVDIKTYKSCEVYADAFETHKLCFAAQYGRTEYIKENGDMYFCDEWDLGRTQILGCDIACHAMLGGHYELAMSWGYLRSPQRDEYRWVLRNIWPMLIHAAKGGHYNAMCKLIEECPVVVDTMSAPHIYDSFGTLDVAVGTSGSVEFLKQMLKDGRFHLDTEAILCKLTESHQFPVAHMGDYIPARPLSDYMRCFAYMWENGEIEKSTSSAFNYALMGGNWRILEYMFTKLNVIPTLDMLAGLIRGEYTFPRYRQQCVDYLYRDWKDVLRTDDKMPTMRLIARRFGTPEFIRFLEDVIDAPSAAADSVRSQLIL
jgi:hypothetical protein